MSSQILKLGIAGLDGHGPVFTRLINGLEPQIEAMRVVAAMPIPSVMIPRSKLDENVANVKEMGVEIVGDADALAARADGVLVCHDDGSLHLDLARQLAGKGKPIFVDKPLEVSTAAACELVELCERVGCPLFSASSLRFSVELQECLARSDPDSARTAFAFSPYDPTPTMPGWFYYGVHAVEPLYQILGPGCSEVRCTPGDTGPAAVGTWHDGRIGIARATRGVRRGYGFTVWLADAIESRIVQPDRLYPELLKKIKAFVETGEPPVSPVESLEVVAFMEAANTSMEHDGKPVPLRK